MGVSWHMTIADAYACCRTITYTHAKTFYFASRFIPEQKRNACYAVYAFCRYVDDIVDVAMQQGRLSNEQAIQLCMQWKTDLETLYSGGEVLADTSTKSAILIAWEHTLATFSIPQHLPNELIEGVLMDTTISRFATFDELWKYCYKVASVVGLMTTEIFGYTSSQALPRAIDLGIAMQLTNIIRDVGEDAKNDRIYLPLDELQGAGISQADILACTFTPVIGNYIAMNVARANSYYDRAQPGISLLHKDARATVLLMSNNYRKILRVVQNMNYNVFQQRARTSIAQKLASVPWALFQAQFIRG
jgi:15-cis-phytoene synthase